MKKRCLVCVLLLCVLFPIGANTLYQFYVACLDGNAAKVKELIETLSNVESTYDHCREETTTENKCSQIATLEFFKSYIQEIL